MDPRRFLILAGAGLLLSGCAVFRGGAIPPAGLEAAIATVTPLPDLQSGTEKPVPQPESPTERPYLEAATPVAASTPVTPADPRPMPALTGRPAIAAANSAANAPSRSDSFQGGMQVFAWSPGRVYEVWTAPLRVTTLTLGEGETRIAKAAGDTVRWQIG